MLRSIHRLNQLQLTTIDNMTDFLCAGVSSMGLIRSASLDTERIGEDEKQEQIHETIAKTFFSEDDIKVLDFIHFENNLKF